MDEPPIAADPPQLVELRWTARMLLGLAILVGAIGSVRPFPPIVIASTVLAVLAIAFAVAVRVAEHIPAGPEGLRRLADAALIVLGLFAVCATVTAIVSYDMWRKYLEGIGDAFRMINEF